ncbi:MarR family winged helix-turn-helix transcriptional regulator [Sporolactobacillus sp. CQH2019]|nr:MarR family winged helix-turn-helix transcriptional regulator [Sporolactobacillus sp. CQH2019]MDD9150489.1 MarR family winged helix-turn-helix transcriptional regulator [Sporolactobacillus sp. CQH2019]
MTTEEQILALYHGLLALDNNDDQEKQWLIKQVPEARDLSTLNLHILSFLKAYPHSHAINIAAKLGILRGTLSKQLTRLEHRGLLTMQTDSKDSRARQYQLTSLGERIASEHDRLLVLKNQRLKKCLSAFPTEKLNIIQQFLNAVWTVERQANDDLEPIDKY